MRCHQRQNVEAIQINLILSCCVHAHAAILFGVFVLLLTNALSHTVKKEKKMRVVDVVYINKEKINILSQSTEYFPQNLRNNQDGIFSNVKQVISQ